MNRTHSDGDYLIKHVHNLFAPPNKIADLNLISLENVIQVVTVGPAIHRQRKLR